MNVAAVIDELAKLPELADEIRDVATQLDSPFAHSLVVRLRDVADRLAEKPRQEPATPATVANGTHSRPAFGMTQKELLENFLRGRKPLTRSEILTQSGLDEGVLRNYLRADYFKRDEQGRWSVIEAKQSSPASADR